MAGRTMIRGHLLGSAILMAVLAAPSMAGETAVEANPETRIGEEGFTSPPTSLGQLDWLVGQWNGDGIGGAPAMESWLPPTGNTTVGTFVQLSEGGGIQFTEHLYLMEEDDSLVLRLKHFNADLTGREKRVTCLFFAWSTSNPAPPISMH